MTHPFFQPHLVKLSQFKSNAGNEESGNSRKNIKWSSRCKPTAIAMKDIINRLDTLEYIKRITRPPSNTLICPVHLVLHIFSITSTVAFWNDSNNRTKHIEVQMGGQQPDPKLLNVSLKELADVYLSNRQPQMINVLLAFVSYLVFCFHSLWIMHGNWEPWNSGVVFPTFQTNDQPKVFFALFQCFGQAFLFAGNRLIYFLRTTFKEISCRGSCRPTLGSFSDLGSFLSDTFELRTSKRLHKISMALEYYIPGMRTSWKRLLSSSVVLILPVLSHCFNPLHYRFVYDNLCN